MIPTKVVSQHPKDISPLLRLDLNDEERSSVKRLFTATLGLDPIVGVDTQQGRFLYEHVEKDGRATGFRVVEVPRGRNGIEYLFHYNPRDLGHLVLAETITRSLRTEHGFRESKHYPFLSLLEREHRYQVNSGY